MSIGGPHEVLPSHGSCYRPDTGGLRLSAHCRPRVGLASPVAVNSSSMVKYGVPTADVASGHDRRTRIPTAATTVRPTRAPARTSPGLSRWSGLNPDSQRDPARRGRTILRSQTEVADTKSMSPKRALRTDETRG